jgi:hypothetical protein
LPPPLHSKDCTEDQQKSFAGKDAESAGGTAGAKKAAKKKKSKKKKKKSKKKKRKNKGQKSEL